MISVSCLFNINIIKRFIYLHLNVKYKIPYALSAIFFIAEEYVYDRYDIPEDFESDTVL